jgi:hypothetical protein
LLRRRIMMKNRKVQIVMVIVLAILSIWLFPSVAGGQREGISSLQVPANANPRCPKVRHLCCKEQRQGYSQSFIIDENRPLMEVPEGKCYVLLRLYSRLIAGDIPNPFETSIWTLTIDEEIFLDELSLSNPFLDASGPQITGILKEDFPDKCVVVKGGETLGIIKNEAVEKLSITLIGYFYDTP